MLVRDVPGCRGCPMFQDGRQPFVGDELYESAPVMVVGQNPGEEEEAHGKPFVGKTGRTMEKTYFKAAGLERGKVSIANTLRCRWQGSNELPPLVQPKQAKVGKKGLVEEAIEHCQKAHGHIPSGTKLIITQGEYALWSVTGQRSVTSWRGWLLPVKGQSQGWKSQVWTPSPQELPVLATVHLAAIFKDTSLQLPTLMDWRKVPKILKGAWPTRLPSYTTDPPAVWPQVAAFDTEFERESGELIRYSLYDNTSTLRVVEAYDTGSVPMAAHTGVSPTVFMHNIEADIVHLERMLGSRVHELRLEDTMLMHAVLWSDLPHDLEYLASLYGRLNRHKHLFETNPLDYSAGDAVVPWDIAAHFMQEFREDPASWWIYRNAVFPLLPIISEAERVGMALDQEKVDQAITHFSYAQQEVTREAQSYVGWPINLGSPEMVNRWLYTVEKVGYTPKGKKRDNRPRR